MLRLLLKVRDDTLGPADFVLDCERFLFCVLQAGHHGLEFAAVAPHRVLGTFDVLLCLRQCLFGALQRGRQFPQLLLEDERAAGRLAAGLNDRAAVPRSV